MNSMKKNNKTNVWIYWLIVWESGDSVSCTAHPKCVRSIEWSVDRVCVWARESRRAIGSRSVVCRIYVHDVYTKLSEPNESTRAAAAAVHSVKKEKDNIKIDDFNSVSIALPDSKLVNIVVFLPCIFVCDINAHRDFSSASTIRFFFAPLLLVLTLVTRFIRSYFSLIRRYFRNILFFFLASLRFDFDWH